MKWMALLMFWAFSIPIVNAPKMNFNNYQIGTIMKTTNQTANAPKNKLESYKDITSVEAACEYLELDYDNLMSKEKDLPEDVFAYMCLRIVTRAINNGELMDFRDDRWMYRPWLWVRELLDHVENPENEIAGFGCSDAHLAPSTTAACVGSRLCFISRARCEFAMANFPALYAKFYNPTGF